jgi:hypothetical protein
MRCEGAARASTGEHWRALASTLAGAAAVKRRMLARPALMVACALVTRHSSRRGCCALCIQTPSPPSFSCWWSQRPDAPVANHIPPATGPYTFDWGGPMRRHTHLTRATIAQPSPSPARLTRRHSLPTTATSTVRRYPTPCRFGLGIWSVVGCLLAALLSMLQLCSALLSLPQAASRPCLSIIRSCPHRPSMDPGPRNTPSLKSAGQSLTHHSLAHTHTQTYSLSLISTPASQSAGADHTAHGRGIPIPDTLSLSLILVPSPSPPNPHPRPS